MSIKWHILFNKTHKPLLSKITGKANDTKLQMISRR